MLDTSTKITQGEWQLTRLARRSPLLTFFLLAYFLGWVAFLPLVLTNIGLGVIAGNVPVEFIFIGASTPTVAALWTQRLTNRNFRICHLYSSWRRLLLGILVGLALMAIAFVILPGILLVKVSPRALHWSALSTLAVYGVNWSTFLGGPVNEEPGWRGFALPRLEAQFGPVVGSIQLGLLWAGWHLPLFLVRGWVNVPVWAFALILVSVSVLMTWGLNLSGSSIMVPMLMHALLNISSRLLGALCQGVPTREPDLPIYLCAGGAVATAAILLTRGRLGRSSATPSASPIH
jgi:CAAX protease family protein